MNQAIRYLGSFILSLLVLMACAAPALAATPIHASKSTAVASPTTVPADGVSTSTITVTINRSNGQSAGSGITVTLTAASGSSIILTSPATTNNLGVVTFTVKDSVVEAVTYTAVATDSGGNTITLTQKPIVNFVRAAPTVVKSFSPATIAANGTGILTITLTNPNAVSITGLTFADAYPAGLVNAAAPALSNTCGGTATGNAGGTSLSLSGGTIPASSSCKLSITVTSATAGSYLNSTGAVTSTNALAGTAATATLVVTAISATNSTVVASPTIVLADGVSISTITVTLRDGANLAVAGKTVTLTAASGSSSITTLVGTTNASGQATFTVKDATVETVTYTAKDTTDNITVTQTASVDFIAVPTIFKSFSPATIAANGTSTLSIKLTNTSSSIITTIAFTDNYPTNGAAGQLVNASTPAVTNTCGGTTTAAAGGTSLALSGGSLAKATGAGPGTCTVTVQVTAAASGTYTNNTGTVSSSAGNLGSYSAALTVVPVSAILSTVSASPTSVPADGTTKSTITVTLKDGAGNAVAGKTVSLTAGTGSSVITAVSNAAGVATFTVTDTIAEGPITYTATDTTDNITIIQTAAVTFTRLSAPTVSKSFSPSLIADYGTSTLTITLTNPNTAAITGVAFTDNYPLTGGLANTTPLVLGNTCGGSNPNTLAAGTTLALSGGTIPASGSCAVSVQVTAVLFGAVPNTIVNSTGVVTSLNATSGTSASATLTDVAVSAANSTLVASPTSVPADNATASTITVTLKDGAGNPVAGINVSLAAGGGSSSITATGATPGVSDVNGQATFTVIDAVVETVTYTATDTSDSPNVVVTQTATVAFTAIVPVVANFNAVESGSNALSGRLYTKLAGQNFALDIVALTATNTIATSFTGTVSVEVVDSSTGGGVCASMSVITSLTNQTFVAGDAGRHPLSSPNTVSNVWPNARMRIKYPTSSPTVIACSGDNFAIRPSAVTLNVSPSMALPPSSTATPTIKAAASFTLTATTSPSGYAGTLSLDAGKLTAQITSQDTSSQSGGTVGTLTPSSLTANATPSNNAAYTEVGYLYLAPGAFRDDGYTSVDQPSGCAATNSCDCVTDTTGDANLSDTISSGKYGCSIGNKTGYSFGRFIPDHFDTVVTGPMACASGLTCAPGSMVYSGQAFTTQVTAYNAAATPAVTQNYASAFAKAVTLYAYDNAGGATLNPGSGVLSSNTLLASAFTAGVATTATPVYTFGTVPTAPTNIYIRAIETSGVDIVSSLRSPASSSLEGGVTVVSGRIKISNAFGSELLPLNLTASAQYYSGSNWANNSADTTSNLALSATYNLLDKSGSVTGTTAASKNPAIGMNAGKVTITLAKPTGGATGTATITPISIPGYFPPTSGTATFGVYKGSDKFIYQRENY